MNGEPYQTLANIMTSFDNHAVRQTRNLPKASIRNSLLMDDVIIDESYPESTFRVAQQPSLIVDKSRQPLRPQ